MNDKKQAENTVANVENATPPEKDLISSEDVLAVISGDQVALVEQMERAKEAALSQKNNAQEIAAEKAKKKLEEEEKKKKAVMAEVKRRKEEALRRELLAKEEAERKKAEAEAERQRQLAEKKRLEEEAKAKAEQERLELERKKQEKEAAIKAKEDAKKAKIQARIDAKKAKQEAKEAAKRAKIEARENAKKAKEDAKKARIEAKKAKAQARLDAKKKKNEPKESSTVVPQQKVVQPVSPAPIPQPKAVSHPTSPPSQPKVASQPTSVPSQPKVVAPQQKSVVPSQAVTTNSSSTTQNTKSTVADNTKSNPDKKTKKESNLKYYMTFIFFALLIWMVAFLPEISSFVSNYMASKQQEGVPAITTGTLTCTMNTNDDKYDYYYEADFNFKDSKMYRLTFSATTKGDQNLDAIELSGMLSSCDLLQQQTANLEGVEVSCSLSNGVYENVQKLDYEDLKSDLVTTAYLEAGGTYPNYEYGQDINEIEKEMKASNYTCERHS